MINTVMLAAHAWISTIIGSAVSKLREERGQDILEYAILAGAIALVAATALFIFLDNDSFGQFADAIEACIVFDTDNCGI